jgi:hypothetical protein
LRMIEKMKYRAPMNVERKGWVKVNILEDQQVVVEAFGWTQIHLIQAMPFSIPNLYECLGDNAWTIPLFPPKTPHVIVT